MSVEAVNSKMDINDKKKIVSDLAYAINCILLSLYHGNTNQN